MPAAICLHDAFITRGGKAPSPFIKPQTQHKPAIISDYMHCAANLRYKNKKRPACVLAEGAYNLYGQSPF